MFVVVRILTRVRCYGDPSAVGCSRDISCYGCDV